MNLGLVGLMLACLLAAMMSSADTYMIVTSALVVRNVYAAYINPEADEKKCFGGSSHRVADYCWCGRCVFGLFGCLWAIQDGNGIVLVCSSILDWDVLEAINGTAVWGTIFASLLYSLSYQ